MYKDDQMRCGRCTYDGPGKCLCVFANTWDAGSDKTLDEIQRDNQRREQQLRREDRR